MRVAVIGAGPAGLAAAWELTERGVDVDLLEREPQAGGLLRTEEIDGAQVDLAVQLVASAHSSFIELLGQAGAGGLLRRTPGRDALWRRGRPHGITYGSVSSMVGSGALPTTLKLKLGAKYLPYLHRHAQDLDAMDLPGSGGEHFDRQSIATWGRRELGDEFVELLAYPLLAAYYGALPEETSAGVYHALARVGMDVTVHGAAGGFGSAAATVLEALESRGCRFRSGTEVRSVAPSLERVLVDDVAYDGAVLAVPANRAAAVLDADGELGAWLGAVLERSTLTVALRLNRAFPGDYFGLSFPRATPEGRRVAAVCVHSRKLPGLVPEGSDALVVLPAPSAVAALLDRSDDEVVGALLGDLDGAVRGLGRHVTAARVYRFEDAYTVFEPGHIRRLHGYDAAWLSPRVALAGDYLTAPSVEGAVRSGRRAGRSVAKVVDVT